MPFASVRDIEVYYELHGTGPRVVLISGTGADLRQNPIRGQGVLEQRCEVLMYDQRGLGQSGKPDRQYTMADYADDCAGLMAAVGWDRAHVMGISFGGMVAQHVALRHPQCVDRLVLACTSAGGAGGSSFDLLQLDELPPAERLRCMMPLLDTRNDLDATPPRLAPWCDVFLQMAERAPSEVDPVVRMGGRRQLEARAQHDTWDVLPRLTMPTLVLGGRFDGQAPVDNVQRLAERIPGARLEWFDGGHLFLLQDLSAYPVVVDFLA